MEAYPALGMGIYEDLGRWEAVLGVPETVPQADGGTTFFYWPERGIAVFTHPQYESQFQHEDREERKVTSVILPLRRSFHPSFLPLDDHVEVQFTELLDLQHVLPDLSSTHREAKSAETAQVDLVSSPLRKTIERLHLVDGEPIAIEVRDTWWLSHYD